MTTAEASAVERWLAELPTGDELTEVVLPAALTSARTPSTALSLKDSHDPHI